jgi:hypothetical protein
MNAAETIQEAIDKLTALRDDAAEGPWLGWVQYNPLRGQMYGVENSEGPIADKVASREDAELIEVLHRTIDAQLAILRAAIEDHPRDRERWLFTAHQTAGDLWHFSNALPIDLASAIVGLEVQS